MKTQLSQAFQITKITTLSQTTNVKTSLQKSEFKFRIKGFDSAPNSAARSETTEVCEQVGSRRMTYALWHIIAKLIHQYSTLLHCDKVFFLLSLSGLTKGAHIIKPAYDVLQSLPIKKN